MSRGPANRVATTVAISAVRHECRAFDIQGPRLANASRIARGHLAPGAGSAADAIASTIANTITMLSHLAWGARPIGRKVCGHCNRAVLPPRAGGNRYDLFDACLMRKTERRRDTWTEGHQIFRAARLKALWIRQHFVSASERRTLASGYRPESLCAFSQHHISSHRPHQHQQPPLHRESNIWRWKSE